MVTDQEASQNAKAARHRQLWLFSIQQNGAEVQGTIEYSKQQVENYRNQLQHRVVTRFDKAETEKDLADMAACAAVMEELENNHSGSSLVQVPPPPSWNPPPPGPPFPCQVLTTTSTRIVKRITVPA